jgi:Zn-finger nucleic acid-binding protein
MKCTSCGAEVEVANVFPGGSVQCTCGTSIVVPAAAKAATPARPAPPPKPVADVTASGACPRCQGPLAKRVEDEIIADVCITGDGLFVEHAHLAALREKGPTASPARSLDRGKPVEEEETRYLACPRCSERMMRQAAGGGIVVDVCKKHGTWFDAGELRAALAAKPPASLADASSSDRDPAKATLDVALALEQARDDQNARRAIDAAEDVLDTFNWYVLGRDSLRRRPRTW